MTETVPPNTRLESCRRILRAAAASLRRWTSAHRKALSIVLLLFILYTGGLLLAGPYLVRKGLSAAAAGLNCEITAGRIFVNPLALSVTAANLKLGWQDQRGWLVEVPEIYVNLQLSSLFRRALVIKRIALRSPKFKIKRTQDGFWNFASLAGTAPAQAGPSRPLHTVIDAFVMRKGRLDYSDETKGRSFSTALVPLELQVLQFDSQAKHPTKLKVRAKSARGEHFAWTGALTLDPLQSEGKLTIAKLDLAAISKMTDALPFKLTAARATASLHYALNASAQPLQLEIDRAKLKIKDFEARDRSDGALLAKIPSAQMDQLDFSLTRRRVHAKAVIFKKGMLYGRQTAGETGSFRSLFSMPVGSAAQGSTGSPQGSGRGEWEIEVEQAGLQDFAYIHEDQTFEPAAKNSFDAVNLSLRDLKIGANGGAAAELSLRPDGAGEVQANAALKFSPLSVEAKLSAKGVALPPFSPYLGRYANVQITDGAAELSGDFALTKTDGPPQMKFSGRLALSELRCAGTKDSAQFLAWNVFEANGIEWAAPPSSLRIAEVQLAGTEGIMVRRPDGSLNFSNLLIARAEQAPAGEPFDLQVGAFRLSDGRFSFRDESVKPPATLELHDLAGELKPAAPGPLQLIDINLTGKLTPAAPVKVSGQLNLAGKPGFNRMTFSLTRAQLVTINPYARYYAGRSIEGGSYSITLDYHAAADKLRGKNKIVLRDLRLGGSAPSPEQGSSIPLDLVVSLLRGPDGDVVLEFPVEGDTKSPQFQFGGVVLDAVQGLFTNILTSPFSVLASLAGSDEELDHIEFAFGSAALSETERQKLAALAKALAARPALKLAISAPADAWHDRWALADAALSKRMGDLPDKEDYARRILKEHRGRIKAQKSAAPAEPPANLVQEFSGMEKIAAPEVLAQKKLDLLEAESIPDSALEDLARRRGAQVREQLTGQGNIAAERLTVNDPDFSESEDAHINLRLSLK